MPGRIHGVVSDAPARNRVLSGGYPTRGWPRTLAGEAQALQAQLASEPGSRSPGASALTVAELRLLPLLSTHLSFPEIAEEMFLSPNTIKSEATSIYRKLGVSSRSQAVSRSVDLGLLTG